MKWLFIRLTEDCIFLQNTKVTCVNYSLKTVFCQTRLQKCACCYYFYCSEAQGMYSTVIKPLKVCLRIMSKIGACTYIYLRKSPSPIHYNETKYCGILLFAFSGRGHCPSAWRSWIRASWYNYENNERDTLYRLIYYSKSAVHVSGDVFAHHQEHLTVFTVSGSVHPTRCTI